jgi:hypothetical protein
MREAMAVTGYVLEELATRMSRGSAGVEYVEVRPEKDVNDVVIRVAVADVQETRVGAAGHGVVLVQLILRDGAAVETVVRSAADPAGLRAFHDPVLNRVRQEATAKRIMI